MSVHTFLNNQPERSGVSQGVPESRPEQSPSLAPTAAARLRPRYARAAMLQQRSRLWRPQARYAPRREGTAAVPPPLAPDPVAGGPAIRAPATASSAAASSRRDDVRAIAAHQAPWGLAVVKRPTTTDAAVWGGCGEV